uniref:Lipoxygenase domain-containing protein n=1 Tax=Zooxanthella nutricula TaxID=1333877 RepID=A0A7S2KAS5_9DINO
MAPARLVASLLLAGAWLAGSSREGGADHADTCVEPTSLLQTRAVGPLLGDFIHFVEFLEAVQRTALRQAESEIGSFVRSGVFQMPVAPEINWPALGISHFGITKYPGFDIPKVNNALDAVVDVLKYNLSEQADFIAKHTSKLTLGLVAYKEALDAAFVNGTTTENEVFELAQVSASIVTGTEELLTGQARKAPFIQGQADRAWDTDTFASTLIGNSLLAIFLEELPEEGPGGATFVLDFSGEIQNGASRLQELKVRAVRNAPSTLLRARGFLKNTHRGPVLTQVQVGLLAGEFTRFNPDGPAEQWSVAKQTLGALGQFVVETFHTATHLFGGSSMEAAQRSLPFESLLHGALSPSATLTAFTLLEQAAILHSSHNSVFSGLVYDTNIDGQVALSADIADFFFESTPEEILGMERLKKVPKWWLGGAPKFVKPISEFSKVVGQNVVKEAADGDFLEKLSVQLFSLTSFSDARVVTQGSAGQGFSKFFSNVMLVCGILHTAIFATREAITPLMGRAETAGFAPVLLGAQIGYNPSAQISQVFGALLNFATAAGYDAAPELGDGPYPGFERVPALARAAAKFQSDLNASRQDVLEFFGADYGKKVFLPAFYYPKNTPKPFGYGIVATTYI